MDKRLNRSDLMFSLAFLLMLVIAIGAFFYGVQVGTERTTLLYAPEELQEVVPPPSPHAYQQQDLVSFYHTVFLPYREFQNNLLTSQNKWLAEPTIDRMSSMKELTKSAQKQYDEIKHSYVPPTSPLLKNAQTSYMKSLKLYSESFSKLAPIVNLGTVNEAIANINKDSFYKEARIQSLKAQTEYYDSMLNWAATIDSDFPLDYQAPEILSLSKWIALPLIIKNKLSSDYLASQLLLTNYLPHDLTARIDHFISIGQADKRKVKSFSAIAELLTSTEAIRSGDFIEMKSRFYENDQLPQLPFFFMSK